MDTEQMGAQDAIRAILDERLEAGVSKRHAS
jgi:hypothetical protein